MSVKTSMSIFKQGKLRVLTFGCSLHMILQVVRCSCVTQKAKNISNSVKTPSFGSFDFVFFVICKGVRHTNVDGVAFHGCYTH